MTCNGLAVAVARLDAWLETMRGAEGYTGPIAHWWESNFLYTGALYDWRYEGIIDGYRELFLRTGNMRFLERALTAADDILPHLLPDGRLRNSSFQFGPVRGGTPHEAAIDVALLKLVCTLRDQNLGTGDAYLHVARENLEGYWFGTLWNGKGFQDQPYNSVLVENKHGTLLEALLVFEKLTGTDYGTYRQACVDVICDSQVRTGPQQGGTVHRGIGRSQLAIPIYTARAMNGLLSYYEARQDARVREPLIQAAAFVQRLITPCGVAWGVYGSGRLCLNPQLIAGSGDVLRFLHRMHALGLAEVEPSVEQLSAQLIAQQQPGGGLPTAHGFTRKGLLGKGMPELRDALPVVGWVDKAFRALVCLLPPQTDLPAARPETYQLALTWRDQRCTFTETPSSITVTDVRDCTLYDWQKGSRSPNVYAL